MNVNEPGGPPHGGGPWDSGLSTVLIVFTAFLSLALTGPFLWALALIPSALGVLTAVWCARALGRRARRVGRRSPFDAVLIVLAGLPPTALVYVLVVIRLATG